MLKAMAVTIMALAALPTAAFAQCKGALHAQVGRVEVASLSTKLFFRTSDLQLDFDGSPIAYGARDQGQENICVGLAPNSGSCRGRYSGPCYVACQQTFAAWVKSGGSVATIAKTMCSVGLGGGGCSVPQVQLQAPPHSDYFVSETSLKTAPDPQNSPTNFPSTQAAQLDPSKIAYLVAPGLRKYGISFGDVGIAFNKMTGTQKAFIVGDGGALGEASVSVLIALNPKAPPRPTLAKSALGEQVMRYKSGISGDFRFVIFPRSGSMIVGHHPPMTSLTSMELPAWIDAQAAAFARKVSIEDLAACTASLKH